MQIYFIINILPRKTTGSFVRNAGNQYFGVPEVGHYQTDFHIIRGQNGRRNVRSVWMGIQD